MRRGWATALTLGLALAAGLISPDPTRSEPAARAGSPFAVAAQEIAARPASLETLIDGLIAAMTLDEKVGQLVLTAREAGAPPALVQAVETGRVGAVLSFFEPDEVLALRAAARRSRLGIPLLFAKDILHGVRSITPVPLGLAATFDPDLVERTGRLDADEARRIGTNWALGPTVDIARDARWGRMVDGFGEEPLLASLMGAARTRGLVAGGLVSGPKHFVGYGAVEAGRDYAAAEIAPTTLHDVHLPPFRAAIDAGGSAVMAAFHVLNGRPVSADAGLLTDLLHRTWRFDGLVVSDWNAVAELTTHGVAATPADAARIALLAGIDIDMNSGLYAAHLADEVRAGRVPLPRLEDAVRRVLRVKLRASLAATPDPVPTALATLVPAAASRSLARQAAERSIVLLHNDANALPIGPQVRRIALVGPQSADPEEHIGPLVTLARWNDGTSTWTALQAEARARGLEVTHAPGCDLDCRDEAGFGAAVASAAAADLVIAVLGERREWASEGQSRTSLELPGRQQALLDRLIATGKPVVLVVLAGRPLALEAARTSTAAMLHAFYPGIEGGPALVDILFGTVNPSGRMPVTTPRHVGQVPIFLGRLPTGRPYQPGNRYTSHYVDRDPTPLFPFGWGLSYSRFAYTQARLMPAEVAPGTGFAIEVSVRNDGPLAGEEVVQVYGRQRLASRSRPERQLLAFTRVWLEAGETRRVNLAIPAERLAFHDADGRRVQEAGPWEIRVGGHSNAETILPLSVRALPASPTASPVTARSTD
jgi:beta-glucosidase